jgi:hypothetical protein
MPRIEEFFASSISVTDKNIVDTAMKKIWALISFA